jgi:hypothetical protein
VKIVDKSYMVKSYYPQRLRDFPLLYALAESKTNDVVRAILKELTSAGYAPMKEMISVSAVCAPAGQRRDRRGFGPRPRQIALQLQQQRYRMVNGPLVRVRGSAAPTIIGGPGSHFIGFSARRGDILSYRR